MSVQHFDIVISGGGIAGLTAAAALAQAGFTVQCLDPAPPITDRETKGADMRTTAFLQPAQALLERAGLWSRLEDHAAALQVDRCADPPETSDRRPVCAPRSVPPGRKPSVAFGKSSRR